MASEGSRSAEVLPRGSGSVSCNLGALMSGTSATDVWCRRCGGGEVLQSFTTHRRSEPGKPSGMQPNRTVLAFLDSNGKAPCGHARSPARGSDVV